MESSDGGGFERRHRPVDGERDGAHELDLAHFDPTVVRDQCRERPEHVLTPGARPARFFERALELRQPQPLAFRQLGFGIEQDLAARGPRVRTAQP